MTLRSILGMLAIYLAGCSVPGTVGETSSCTGCGPKQLCNETNGKCVECLNDDDCLHPDAATEDQAHCLAGHCRCRECSPNTECDDSDCQDHQGSSQHED